MKEELLPTNFVGINEPVYAGFWVRFAAKLLDCIVMLPVIGLVFYINGLSKSAAISVLIPNMLFTLAFEVVLVKLYGGTPGKLMMGLKIIRKNGDDMDWKSAFYRYSVEFVIAFIGAFVMYLTLNLIDDANYASAGFLERSKLLSTVNPVPMQVQQWLSNTWYIIGLVVLISNVRKRSTHDFIAGTVVVKSVYLDKIRETMNPAIVVESKVEE